MGINENLVNDLESAQTGGEDVKNTLLYDSLSKINVYQFMDYAYHGTGGFRDGKFLVPHSREMFYNTRRDLCFYKNFVKPITRAMVEPIFSKPAPRKVGTADGSENKDAKFNLFIDDCDNAGTPLQSFSEDFITTARLHGLNFCIVDNFTTEAQPATENEAVENRIFPYVYERSALQVKDSKIDKYGNIESISFWESPAKDNEGKPEKRYMYWDKNKSVLYGVSESGSERTIEPREHNLGVIPVIAVYSGRRQCIESIYVDPPLYDIAKLNHAIFNKDSEIRELERNQGFSVFYVQGKSGNLTIGTNNVLFIPEGATIAPNFASPNPAIQANLMNNNDKMREDLFRIAEQNGVMGVQSARSGIAMQWDFFAHESVLKKTSAMATALEQRIADIFALYTNEVFIYIVAYPQSFQPNDKLVEINIYDKYLMMDIPESAKALAREKATRLLFADEDKTVVDTIIDDIKQESIDKKQSELDQANRNQGGGNGNDEGNADAGSEGGSEGKNGNQGE